MLRRRLLFAVLAAFFGFLTALAWYVYDHGFTKKWRNYVIKQFRKEGVEVSIRRVTLDPFRGFVGRDVKVYDPSDRRRVLAVIDQAVLGINYANAFRGRPFLDSIELRDAKIALPLDPLHAGGETVEIAHLNARLFLPPQQIYLAAAEAQINGVRVSAAGRLINPQEFHFAHDEQISPGAFFARIVAELKSLKYDDERPTLRIEFSGDLAHPTQISADVQLHARDVRETRRKKYRVRRIDIVATCRAGVAELEQFEVEDTKGIFQAQGVYAIKSQMADLHVRSNLDFQTLNRAFRLIDGLDDWYFQEAPKWEATLQGRLGAAPEWTAFGHLGLGNFTVKSAAFDHLSVDGSWSVDARGNVSWSVRDLALGDRTGEWTADLMQQPGRLRGEMRGKMNPKALLPLLSGSAAEWLGEFEFAEAPELYLNATGEAFGTSACRVAGDVRFRGATFRREPAKGDSHVRYAQGVLTLAPFPNEEAGSEIVFDFQRKTVRQTLPAPALPEDGVGQQTGNAEPL